MACAVMAYIKKALISELRKLCKMVLGDVEALVLRHGHKPAPAALGGTSQQSARMSTLRRSSRRLSLGRAAGTDKHDDAQGGREEDSDSTEYILHTLENLLEMMRLLRWFAEGHNSELQHYVRSQPDNEQSYDLVSQTVDILELLESIVKQSLSEQRDSLSNSLTQKLVTVLKTVLETLAELVQGPCRLNQVGDHMP